MGFADFLYNWHFVKSLSFSVEASNYTNIPEKIACFDVLQLTWEFTPEDTFNQGLEFTSSNEDVLTVSETGLLTAVSEGTATVTVKVLADESLTKTYEVTVYTPGRVTITSTGSSVLEVGGSVQLEATLEGEVNGGLVFTSSDNTVATVDETGKVTALKAGSTVIKAEVGGKAVQTSLTINVNDSTDEVAKYIMSVLKAQINTSMAVTYDDYGKGTYFQLTRGVSNFLFEDLTIKDTYKRTQSSDYDFVNGVSYITIHDTGNMSKGATAAANASYFQSADTSIHFVTGNDGIFAGVGLTQRAAHAGDGTDRVYALEKTNVKVTDGEPVITMKNGNFCINGVETECRPYEDHAGTIKTTTNYTTEQITWSGIRCVAGEDGYYYLGKTYFNTTYKLISNFGGNASSIGIESCVNEGTDYYLTMQRTAKLVAYLMDMFNLSINDVKMHNFFSGKNCAQLMKNNSTVKCDYKQDGYELKDTVWGEFLELVKVEYEMFKYAKDYTITFTSNSKDILDNTGRVLKYASSQQEASYTITITNKTTNAKSTINGSVLIPSVYELNK